MPGPSVRVPTRNFKRILIVRLSSLGDVIQTLPIPTVVRDAYPDAEIGWAIDRDLAPAITGHPDVDHIHLCNRVQWGRRLKNPSQWRRVAAEARHFIDEIREVGYDCALDAQGLLKSALIPFFAGIRPRIGFAHGRELSHLFYTERYLSNVQYFDHERMHVDHMMALAQTIGCRTDNYSVRLPPAAPESRAKIDALLRFKADRSRTSIGFAPATQWKSKQWPPEHWRSLLEMVLARTEVNVVLIGAASDAAMTSHLTEALDNMTRTRVLDLAGKTSIVDLYALFERIPIMVAADTAPLHIAGAAGCTLIGLFGATPTHRTGPIGSGPITLMSAEPKLACQPCQERVCRFGTTECMRNLRPQLVFDVIERALRATEGDDRKLNPSKTS
jgi:heptosyltransferase I